MKLLYLILTAGIIFVLLFFMNDRFDEDDVELKSWAINQIDNDLSLFKKTKFKELDIEDAYKNLSNIDGNIILRFQIIDGNLYSNYNDLDKTNAEIAEANNILHRFLGNLIKHHGFNKNVEFIVSVSEKLNIPSDYNLKAPIIVPFKNPQDSFASCMLIAPDRFNISEWPRLYSDILGANSKYPWNRKIEKAFWRGSSTGGVYTRENWQDFPRVKLVELSIENPNLLDAKFTALAQHDYIAEIISEKFPLAIAVSQSDHVKYKIQVSIDPNSTSLSGFLWRLLSSSLVLRQKSNNAQWFYPLLHEGQHYIAIEHDMSDLLDKVKWALEHDEEAKNIAFAGSELIKNEITPDHLYLYWGRLLSEYSKLQDFNLKTPSLDRSKYID
jgi:hypothetical protein